MEDWSRNCCYIIDFESKAFPMFLAVALASSVISARCFQMHPAKPGKVVQDVSAALGWACDPFYAHDTFYSGLSAVKSETSVCGADLWKY